MNRFPGKKSIERTFCRFELAGIDERPTACEIDNEKTSIQLTCALEIIERGLPVSVVAVQLAAFDIQIRITGIVADFDGQSRNLLVDGSVRSGCDRCDQRHSH
jgi:hypothetical protein